MKYIDAEKLKKIVEQAKQRALKGVEVDEDMYCDGRADAFGDVLLEIDSLQQEQQEVNFKIEERKWVHDAVDNIFPEDGDFMSEVDFRKILKDTAHHFYELGRLSNKK